MTDKDLEYVAALLQNTICVWNFSQGQWNMTTGVDRRDLSMASGIAIPPTADDSYPEPCLMLASTQNPAQTRGQDFNCDVDAQQMASVPATGHFDYIRINPNNVKAFNTHSGIGVMNATQFYQIIILNVWFILVNNFVELNKRTVKHLLTN